MIWQRPAEPSHENRLAAGGGTPAGVELTSHATTAKEKKEELSGDDEDIEDTTVATEASGQ